MGENHYPIELYFYAKAEMADLQNLRIGYLIMSTLKQKNVVVKIIENRGNISKSMRDVGYSKQTAKNPKNLTESDGFAEEAKPIIEQLEEERKEIFREMKLKRKSAQYQHLNSALDTTSKLIQLLSGGLTDNFGFELNDNQFEQLIRERKKTPDSPKTGERKAN